MPTHAEAIKLAACMNQLYVDGAITLKGGSPWYQPYVEYCLDNKIIYLVIHILVVVHLAIIPTFVYITIITEANINLFAVFNSRYHIKTRS